MINPANWNWGGKIGYCLATLPFIYTFYRVPASKGRIYAELDLLFEQTLSARQFRDTQVDVFDDGHNSKGQVEMGHGTSLKSIIIT